MLAKSMTVLGKLLTAAIFISNTAYANSWDKPVYQTEVYSTSGPALIFNAYRNLFSRLNKEDSLKHQQAVFHALNRLDNGEVTTWYSYDGYHTGQVQVMATTKLNGDMCRRLYSVITLKSDQRSFEEWACYKTNTNTWVFADK
jgi:surface antigen